MYDIFVNWVYFVTFGSLIGYVIWIMSNLSQLEQTLEQAPEQNSAHKNTSEKPSGNT